MNSLCLIWPCYNRYAGLFQLKFLILKIPLVVVTGASINQCLMGLRTGKLALLMINPMSSSVVISRLPTNVSGLCLNLSFTTVIGAWRCAQCLLCYECAASTVSHWGYYVTVLGTQIPHVYQQTVALYHTSGSVQGEFQEEAWTQV